MKFSLKSLKKSWFEREFLPISYILWCLRSVQAVSEQANFSVVKERHLILARRRLYKTAYHGGFLMAYDALESLISAFIHSRLLAIVECLFAISLKLETTWTLKHHKMSKVDQTSLPKSESLRAFKDDTHGPHILQFQALWKLTARKQPNFEAIWKEDVEFSYLCWSHKPLEEGHSDGGINLRRPFRWRKQLSELWHVATMALCQQKNSDIAGTRWESGMILHRKGLSVKDEALEVQ